MKNSRWVGVVTGCALLSLLTSCGEDEERAEISDAAEAAAEAIATGDFSDIPFESGQAQVLSDAVANLHEPFDDLSPDVEVTETEIDEPAEDSVRTPTAEVTFHHVWDLEEIGVEEGEWTYTTQADYSYDEESDTWRLVGETDLVLPDYSGHEAVSISTSNADRGRIMDGTGRAMVYNRDVVRIGLDKSQLDSEESQSEAASELADVVGIDDDSYADRVVEYGDEAFVEAIIVRTDGGHVSAADVENIPGVHLIYDEMPLAESSDFAPQLLGRVGDVTAEHLENDPALGAGDMVGLSGIQSVHESTLRGSPGIDIIVGDDVMYSVDPESGSDVHTGLMPRMQDLAQEIADDQDVTTGIVAIRPSDGAIIASATHNPDAPQVNSAIESTYAPGSTFKMVSALGMLRDGVSPTSSVPCPNSVTVEGQQFRNVSGFQDQYVGNIPFNTAVAVSCNTTFAAAWDDVSSGDLAEAARDLGMDNEVGIGVQAMKAQVPEEADENLHAANLFGQGTVETSTLGMAAVAASIADGRTVHPWLVERDDHPDGGGLTEEEGEQLRELMRGTVDYGTLRDLDPIPGPHVYAKTGTAEAGSGDDSYSHTWVIGSQGDLAVAVFLEEGEWGSSTNGPLLRDFLMGARDILADQES